MATWLGRKVQDVFKGVLKVSDNNTGITGSAKSVESGDGAVSALELSTTRVKAKAGAIFEGDGSLITNIATSNITDFATDVAANGAVASNTSASHAQSHTIASHSDNVSTADIDNDAVTYAKMQNVSGSSKILGRVSAGTGDVEELTPTQVQAILPREFTPIERIGNVNAMQAVASDTEFFYTTGWDPGQSKHLQLRKYNIRTGDLVLTRNLTFGPDGTAIDQINGIYVDIDPSDLDNSVLMISAMNYPTTPKISYIKEFKVSDLTFIAEHVIGFGSGGATKAWSEDVKKRGTDWWIVWDDLMVVTKYNSSWVWQADYALSYTVTGLHKYNSGVWVGDYFYCNIHEDSEDETCDVYFWNGSSFDEVERLVVPNKHYTNQGMAKEPGLDIMWWAERNYPGVEPSPHRNNVVRTTIPYK